MWSGRQSPTSFRWAHLVEIQGSILHEVGPSFRCFFHGVRLAEFFAFAKVPKAAAETVTIESTTIPSAGKFAIFTQLTIYWGKSFTCQILTVMARPKKLTVTARPNNFSSVKFRPLRHGQFLFLKIGRAGTVFFFLTVP